MPEHTQTVEEAKQAGGGGGNPGQPAPDARQHAAQTDYMRQLNGEKKAEGDAPGTEADAKGKTEPEVEKPGKQSQGLENYEATLGKFLGGQLYKAVSGAVTPDKVQGYANGALKSAIKYLTDTMGKIDGEGFNEKNLTAFGNALNQVLKPYVDQYMSSGPGLEMAEALAEWTDTHPREVATIALLAAIGMVAANAEIPELKTKFGLTKNITATIEARLGTFQNISLESVKARIEAQVPMIGETILKASAEYERVDDPEKGVMHRGKGSLMLHDKDGGWEAGVTGQKDERGTSVDAIIRARNKKRNLEGFVQAGHSTETGSRVMAGLTWRF